ncbi:hypothetical protein EON63_08505 [archaeon]|nr:MAG: hypothetical protein EON63_08505 [archaeon]
MGLSIIWVWMYVFVPCYTSSLPYLNHLSSLYYSPRYSEFICNFSIAATARLYKRFPEYAVRIGSGLHVGWAIEGAIGSNRKIDASYLSPHVNASEFLESSTKGEWCVWCMMYGTLY